MKKTMMIDYRDTEDQICRKEIDDMEFCVHDREVYFISDGVKYHFPLDQVIQVYLN